uniref:Uncharacterized protein n=1 Tax=Ceratitis capitata TaxID=7213 RepID=W8ARJ6_CERCA
MLENRICCVNRQRFHNNNNNNTNSPNRNKRNNSNNSMQRAANNNNNTATGIGGYAIVPTSGGPTHAISTTSAQNSFTAPPTTATTPRNKPIRIAPAPAPQNGSPNKNTTGGATSIAFNQAQQQQQQQATTQQLSALGK